MTATTHEIRDGLRDALERISEDLGVERTFPGQLSNTATAIVRIVGIDYAEAFDGLNLFHCEITLAVRFADLPSAHDDLDLYVDPDGPRSINYAVQLDQTLGGVCEIVNCLRMHDYGDLMIGGATYLGAIFDVDVYAT